MNRKSKIPSRNNDDVIEPKKGNNLNHNACKSSIGTYPKEVRLLPLELRPILNQEQRRKEELNKGSDTSVRSGNRDYERQCKIPRKVRDYATHTGERTDERCSHSSDVYRNILGPTPDESILASLQTVIDICGLGDCCWSDSEDASIPYGTIIESYAVSQTKKLSKKKSKNKTENANSTLPDETFATAIDNHNNTTVDETYATAHEGHPDTTMDDTFATARDGHQSTAYGSAIDDSYATAGSGSPSFVTPSHDATSYATPNSSFVESTPIHNGRSPSRQAKSPISSLERQTTLKSPSAEKQTTLRSSSVEKHTTLRSPSAEKRRTLKSPSAEKRPTLKSKSPSDKGIERDTSFGRPPATSTPKKRNNLSCIKELPSSGKRRSSVTPPPSPRRFGSPMSLIEDPPYINQSQPEDDGSVSEISFGSWCQIDECCGTTDSVPCVKVKAKDGRDVCIKYRCRSIESSLSAKCFPPVEIPPCDTSCGKCYIVDGGGGSQATLDHLGLVSCSVCPNSEVSRSKVMTSSETSSGKKKKKSARIRKKKSKSDESSKEKVDKKKCCKKPKKQPKEKKKKKDEKDKKKKKEKLMKSKSDDTGTRIPTPITSTSGGATDYETTTSKCSLTSATDASSVHKKRKPWGRKRDKDSKSVVIQDPKAGVSLVFDPRYSCNPDYEPSSRRRPQNFRMFRTVPPVVQPVIGVCNQGRCGGSGVGGMSGAAIGSHPASGPDADGGGGERLMEVRYALVRISVFPSYTTYEIMKSSKKKPKKLPDSVEGIFVTKR